VSLELKKWLFKRICGRGYPSLLFVIGFIFVFVLARRAIPLMALIGLLFHALIHTTMSIPFFHLWSLYPTIFFSSSKEFVGEVRHRQLANCMKKHDSLSLIGVESV
jgi:hypothetical protein